MNLTGGQKSERNLTALLSPCVCPPVWHKNIFFVGFVCTVGSGTVVLYGRCQNSVSSSVTLPSK